MNVKKNIIFLFIIFMCNSIMICEDFSDGNNINREAEYNRLINEAKKYMKYNNYTEILQLLLEAEKIKSDDAITIYNIGYTYKQMGENDKAIEYFKKTILLDEYYIPAYGNAGLIYKKLGNFDEAIKWFEKILEYNPKEEETLFNLSEIYFKFKKDYNKAIEIIEKFNQVYNEKLNFYNDEQKKQMAEWKAFLEVYLNLSKKQIHNVDKKVDN